MLNGGFCNPGTNGLNKTTTSTCCLEYLINTWCFPEGQVLMFFGRKTFFPEFCQELCEKFCQQFEAFSRNLS